MFLSRKRVGLLVGWWPRKGGRAKCCGDIRHERCRWGREEKGATVPRTQPDDDKTQNRIQAKQEQAKVLEEKKRALVEAQEEEDQLHRQQEHLLRAYMSGKPH